LKAASSTEEKQSRARAPTATITTLNEAEMHVLIQKEEEGDDTAPRRKDMSSRRRRRRWIKISTCPNKGQSNVIDAIYATASSCDCDLSLPLI
jgi:transcription initiation factor TFIIIB Brf1 subunit/transcription initiation factor TFIIB